MTTTLRLIELTCPVCRNRFTSQAVLSTAGAAVSPALKRHMESLASYDGVTRDERAVLTYLVGELWRRAGNRARAHAWFARLPDEVTDAATQRWVLDAARQQDNDPREWFA